ncbi:MAG: DUF4136 domain-containing protein [Polyangiaceae bacterium]|nr:DUF4136 domain-containing protein [Polyangiaceae bacterium]
MSAFEEGKAPIWQGTNEVMMTFWQRSWAWGAAALVVAISSACSYETLTVAETDVVVTVKEPNTNYQEYLTYSLPPEVVNLCGIIEEGGLGGLGGVPNFDPENCFDPGSAQDRLDEILLESLKANLDDYGWQEVPADGAEAPDVALLAGYIARDNWYVGYAWCYPYYSGWYYGGCWYPGYSYAYNLPTESIMVTMVDTAGSEGQRLDTVWLGLFSGLYANSSELTPEERIQRAVNQAFIDSPYLKQGEN